MEAYFLERFNLGKQGIKALEVEVFASLIAVSFTPTQLVDEDAEGIAQLLVPCLGVGSNLLPSSDGYVSSHFELGVYGIGVVCVRVARLVSLGHTPACSPSQRSSPAWGEASVQEA